MRNRRLQRRRTESQQGKKKSWQTQRSTCRWVLRCSITFLVGRTYKKRQ